MENSKRKYCLLVTIANLALLLSSCSGTASSSGISYAYTVSFVDENGVQVGYQYVPNGHKLGSPRPIDGVSYDFLPADDHHSSTPWNKLIFDKWVGVYDTVLASDGEKAAVDLSNIVGNCTLTATFKETSFTWKAILHNDISLMRDTDGNKLFETDRFGLNETKKMPSISTLTAPTYEKAGDEQWGYSHDFRGFSFSKDPTEDDTCFSLASSAEATYYYGAGVPGASGVSIKKAVDDSVVSVVGYGSLYENTLTEDYYAFDGSWSEILGNISSESVGTVNYYAGYTEVKKTFEVKIFADSSLSGTPLGSINALFQTGLTLSQGDSENILRIGYKDKDNAGRSLDITIPSTNAFSDINKLTGKFSTDSSVPSLWNGKTIDSSQYIIGADISLYPVYF